MPATSQRIIEVWVVMPERTLLLDIAGPLEVLRRANVEQQSLRFTVRYVGSCTRVSSSVGLTLSNIELPPTALPAEAIVIVPGSADRIAFADDPPQSSVDRDERA